MKIYLVLILGFVLTSSHSFAVEKGTKQRKPAQNLDCEKKALDAVKFLSQLNGKDFNGYHIVGEPLPWGDDKVKFKVNKDSGADLIEVTLISAESCMVISVANPKWYTE